MQMWNRLYATFVADLAAKMFDQIKINHVDQVFDS